MEKALRLTARGNQVDLNRACATPYERLLAHEIRRQGNLPYSTLTQGEKQIARRLINMGLVELQEKV